MDNAGEATVDPKTKRGWIVALAAGLLAAVVYAFTLADYAFPGESAAAITAWTGMDDLMSPAHPVWGQFVALVGRISPASSVVFRMNLFSLVCGVLATVLLCRLVRAFVLANVTHENVIPRAVDAADAASAAAAAVFVFAVPVWQASTHLECRIFDVLFALATFALVPLAARFGRAAWALVALAGVLVGMGAVESVIFMPLAPVMALFVAALFRRRVRLAFGALALFVAAAAASFALYTRAVTGGFAAGAYATAAGKTAMDVAVDFWRVQLQEIALWFQRPGWLCVVVFGVLPFVACVFAALRGLGAERSWSQFVFHVSMTACVILAAYTQLSPMELMRLSAKAGLSTPLPVAVSALTAFSAGYLVAYWLLLWIVPKPEDEFDSLPLPYRVARPLGISALSLFALVAFFGSVVNAFNCGRDRGRFADTCAAEVLDRMGGRTWLVTQGILDDNLRILAQVRGQELNIVALQRDTDESYIKRLGALVAEKGLKSAKGDLSFSAALGVQPFVQDWFAGDPDVASKAAVLGVPDFWTIAGKSPVPDGLFFTGADDLASFDGKKAHAEFMELWKRLEKPLYRKRGEALSSVDDPVSRLRLHLRRHLGFLANNLAVALQDKGGMDDEAFQLYELVRKTIDPDNVSALFNEYEMANAKHRGASARKGDIEKEIKALVEDSTKRYSLWSLSRFYGYIRAAEILVRMGYGWAQSAQPGAAISQVSRLRSLLPNANQAAIDNVYAAIYMIGGDAERSRATYLKVLGEEADNKDALLGLARLSMRSGNVEEARDYLGKADGQTGEGHASDVDWAVLHIMDNNLDKARECLHRATDRDPKNLKAWGLLSHTMLQQAAAEEDAAARAKILDEVERVILPKMEAIAGGPKNYYVQVTRGLVLLHRGEARRADARDALLAAFTLSPEMSDVANLLLQQDMALNDKAGAREHARLVLRQDRRNSFANYVLGSLSLGEKDYGHAETFLRAAVAGDKPFAAAENDLAEVLRRERRFEDAEHYARKAVASAPDLYVAWETLASILIDQNKDLDKAEEYLTKAIEIGKQTTNQEDPRMLITRVKVQLKNGNLVRARGTLRSLRARSKEFSEYDLEELDRLAAEAEKAK